jgi:ribosomal protein S18 acetylase RimI-like enzyme
VNNPHRKGSPFDGPRRIRCPQDVPAVAGLLFICFSSALDSSARQMLQQVHWIASQGAVSWKLTSLLGAVNQEEWKHSVVWLEGGRLVANVTLTPRARQEREWLLSNVAVHPDYRRRGIGRELVRFALAEVRALGGRQVYLQVDVENRSAANIYRDLGFQDIGCRATWFLPAGRKAGRRLEGSCVDSVRVAPRRDAEWADEFKLLEECTPSGLVWNSPLRAGRIRPSFWRSMDRLLVGESEAHFLARCDAALSAVLIATRRMYAWEGLLIQRPGTGGKVEAPLVERFLEGGSPERSGMLETTDEADPDVMTGMGFQLRRTLVWMRCDPAQSPESAAGRHAPG